MNSKWIQKLAIAVANIVVYTIRIPSKKKKKIKKRRGRSKSSILMD